MSGSTAWDELFLPDILDANAAEPLAENLLQKRGKQLRMDASRVTRISIPCVQVMLSAARTWKADNQAFEIINASESFQRDLKAAGLSTCQPGIK